MKNIFKNWQKSLVFLSFFVLGAILLAGVVWAATTITNNQVSTRKVANNLADFTVLDFTINVDSDTTLAGTEPTGGTAISADKPGDWTQMKFYDASAGGEWNGGTDWVGNSESNYYQLAATIIGCHDGHLPGTWYQTRSVCETAEYGGLNGSISGWGNGNLKYIQDSDYLCYSGSPTNPTVLFRASDSSCVTLAGDCTSGSESRCYIKGSYNQGGVHLTNAIAQDNGIVYRDGTGGGAYSWREPIFVLPSAYRNIDNPIIFYSTSERLSGVSNPPLATGQFPTSLSASKPADWTTMKFYDQYSGGAQFNSSNDWIGLDNDATGFFADRLNAITFNLHSDANTISPANVSNVKLWAGNPGSGTLLGTASSFDGGGSGW